MTLCSGWHYGIVNHTTAGNETSDPATTIMPKKTLKLLVPSHAKVREIKALQILGEWVYASNLWHINRYSASMAFFVGLFVAFMPIPGQMIVAALLAVLLSCNLPLSISLVWITNPVTMPAIFFLAYKIGAMIIDVPLKDIEFELSIYWLSHSLQAIWRPFLLGCVICGLFFGCLGYFIISLLWRWRVVYHWQQRKKRRALRKLNDPG